MPEPVFRARVCSPDSFITTARLARIIDRDRAVIERLLSQGKIKSDASIGKREGGTSPLFLLSRADEVKAVLTAEAKE